MKHSHLRKYLNISYGKVLDIYYVCYINILFWNFTDVLVQFRTKMYIQ